MTNHLGYRFGVTCYIMLRILLRAAFLGSKQKRNEFLDKHRIRPSTFFFGTSLISKGGITAYARRNSDDYELLFFPREAVIQKYMSSIRDGEVFVDVGANVGYYALRVKGHNPNSKVIAIEVHPDTFAALVRNVKANGFDIECVNKAVYRNRGKITLYEHGGWSGIASIYRKSEKALTIDADTLDGIMSDLGLRPNVMKIDIEGAEIDALQGAEESLRHARLVIIEIHYDNLEPVKQILEAMAFSIAIENNGEYVVGIRPDARP